MKAFEIGEQVVVVNNLTGSARDDYTDETGVIVAIDDEDDCYHDHAGPIPYRVRMDLSGGVHGFAAAELGRIAKSRTPAPEGQP